MACLGRVHAEEEERETREKVTKKGLFICINRVTLLGNCHGRSLTYVECVCCFFIVIIFFLFSLSLGNKLSIQVCVEHVLESNINFERLLEVHEEIERDRDD